MGHVTLAFGLPVRAANWIRTFDRKQHEAQIGITGLALSTRHNDVWYESGKLVMDGIGVGAEQNKNWVLQVFDNAFTNMMCDMAVPMAEEFGVDIHVKVVDEIGRNFDHLKNMRSAADMDDEVRMAVAETPPSKAEEQRVAGPIIGPAIEVNYDQDAARAFCESGCVGLEDWFHRVDLEDVRLEGEGVKYYETMLYRLKKGSGSGNQLQAEIASIDSENPWKPAGIEHLLAFGPYYKRYAEKHLVTAVTKMKGKHTVSGSRAYLRLDEEGNKVELCKSRGYVGNVRSLCLLVREVTRAGNMLIS